MATVDPISDIAPTPAPSGVGLLVRVAAMPPDQLDIVIANLTAAFSPNDLLLATPNEVAADAYRNLRVVSTTAVDAAWSLHPGDFTHIWQLADQNEARAILILGPESASLHPEALRNLAYAALARTTDLIIPCYELPARAALVNSAILYPLTRALFATRVRFPLAVDLGLSPRMAARMAAAAQRFNTLNQSDALLWPVNEASTAGFTMEEIDVGPRALPQPPDTNINAILSRVAGSLFADVEAKATWWQRPRRVPPARNPMHEAPSADGSAEVARMIEAFTLAYSNLLEIWSLVLPPNTLIGLKRLSVSDAAHFRMADNLWARIVYDFLVAYRLRTINRGHLLGALTPLYLAWVATHINVVASGTSAERHIEEVASAFESEKPYLVSRWRWPDRFTS